jgi:alkanesulfonate monooxygenase SsuD/methylene tetrahydromethanopterin reductase-like flavin-dependent oxidoreductase (luciferase family)
MTSSPGRRGFGIALPTSGPFATADNILAVAETAQELGFDDVWVNDHYTFARSRLASSPAGSLEACRDQDPNFFESLTTLAVVGGRLRRIGIAVHAIVLPVRDVRLFAKQICTIQELTGGNRLTIAPAIGGPDAFPVMGVPQSQRGARLDEALEALVTILGSDLPVSFHGRFTQFTDATFYPKPQTIRLWITGDSAQALRRVARYATGWFSSTSHLDEFPTLLEQLRTEAEAAARDARRIVRATDLFVCLASTNAEARAISAATLARRYGSVEEGLKRAAVGDVAAVTNHLRARLGMGFDYLELRFICHEFRDLLEMLRRTAEEVIPVLRAEGAAQDRG